MSKAITLQEFNERVKKRFPTEHFEIISYKSGRQPLEIKCCKCNEIIHVSAAQNFLAPTKAYGCKNCNGLWRERERKLNEIKEKYEIISTQVKDTHTYYTIKCKNCGHERTSTLKNLYTHLNCGCITGVYRNRTMKEFIDEVNKNSRLGTYELVSDYVDQTTKVLLKHDCGFIWSVRPGDAIYGRAACPKCARKESKGESLVRQILTDLNIEFQQEVVIPNSCLRFDFYFQLKNHKFAIEYNGRQHFEDVEFFRTSFAEQQDRDQRKAQYCLDNNIELINIPYWLEPQEVQQLIKDKLNDYLN